MAKAPVLSEQKQLEILAEREWIKEVYMAAKESRRLRDSEERFLFDMWEMAIRRGQYASLGEGIRPSQKQMDWLKEIADRVDFKGHLPGDDIPDQDEGDYDGDKYVEDEYIEKFDDESPPIPRWEYD